VETVPEGTLDKLGVAVDDYAAKGQVLLVMDKSYRLLFLSHEGEVLWNPTAQQ
jgi:hypothetical protein